MSVPSLLYTWLFVRGDEEIRVVRPTPVQLLVSSPPSDARTFDFETSVELLEFQLEFEAHLIKTGWHLEAFSPERRKGRDRRTIPRPVVQERRRES